MNRFKLLIFCISYVIAPLAAQEKVLARITVDPEGKTRIATPVSVSLQGLNHKAGASLRLQEIRGDQRLEVPVQIEKDHSDILWWEMSGITKIGDQRVYELIQETSDEASPTAVQAIKGENTLRILLAGKEVLRYHHAIMPPPENADPLFARSGFIHPLRSPSGVILTRIHAPDHIHHMGLWNPWTKTTFEGREIDFWNLNKGEGTVRFANYASIISGDVYGGFEAIHNHVDLKAPTGEKVALNEEWDIRVWSHEGTNRGQGYLLDFTSILNAASNSTITLEEYRYAGFGFRATEQWHKDNSSVLTSEGKTRSDADATRARWANVSGETKEGRAGILFMSHPTNYNHPEPMRVWPESANGGRGDVFFQFSPTRDRDWELKPGNDYVLKYRMYVYDGTISADDAERIWQDFANPPTVEIEKFNF